MEYTDNVARTQELKTTSQELCEIQECELALVGGGSGDVCLQ